MRQDGELVVAYRGPGVARSPGTRPYPAAGRRVRRSADSDGHPLRVPLPVRLRPVLRADPRPARRHRAGAACPGIRFLDHYSCNVVARPRSRAELELYHAGQRHHVAIHPDTFSAPTAGYDGFRFDDLREIDVGTGEPAYSTSYQAELFCHNNPDFLEMHRRYLLRQFAEAPLDGVMADDMCDYAWFRACGCVQLPAPLQGGVRPRAAAAGRCWLLGRHHPPSHPVGRLREPRVS